MQRRKSYQRAGGTPRLFSNIEGQARASSRGGKVNRPSTQPRVHRRSWLVETQSPDLTNNELVDGFNRNSFRAVRVARNQISEAEDSTGGNRQRTRV